MNNIQDIDLRTPLSIDEAIDLLLNKRKEIHFDNMCFDEFDNYIFPTDMIANTPNTAIGTSTGFAFIDDLCLR